MTVAAETGDLVGYALLTVSVPDVNPVAEWSRVRKSEIPSPPDLNETWGTASDDVYVLGDEGTLVHFDGIAWTRVPGPHTNGTWNSLEAVSGSSSESVVAVGANGTILRGIR